MKNIDKLIENFLDTGKLSKEEKISFAKNELYEIINNIDFNQLPGNKKELTQLVEDKLKTKGIENTIPKGKQDRQQFFEKYGIINYLKNNIVDKLKLLYIDYIFFTKNKNVDYYVTHFKKNPEVLKQIIDGKNPTFPNKDRKINFRDIYYPKVLSGDIPYIYSSRGDYKLTHDQIQLVDTFFESGYEESFLSRGYRKPTKEERPNETRIHNLEPGQLLNNIKDLNKDINDITTEIKGNIKDFIMSDEEIHKYDIIAKRDFGNVIKQGDKIEVKDIKYSDSYLAEPLASPVKMSSDEIRKDEVLLGRYNYIIDNLYEWLKEGGEGESIGKKIINKLVDGLKGFFIHDNIFVPIENFEFYLSNVGQNNPKKHRRLAIRYHIKKGAITYQLQYDGSLKELSPENNGIKYIDKKVYNNLDYISEYVDKLLDL